MPGIGMANYIPAAERFKDDELKEIISLPDNLSIPFYPKSFGKQPCHHGCIGKRQQETQKNNELHGRKRKC
jgi:hypothetical protein